MALHTHTRLVQADDDGVDPSCVDVPLTSVLVLAELEGDRCLAGICCAQNVDSADVFYTAHDCFGESLEFYIPSPF